MRKAGLISGKVKVVDNNNLDPNRYQFLDLGNAEPNLGVPVSNNAIVKSDQDGSRAFLYPGAGIDIEANNITVEANTTPFDTTGFNYSSANTLYQVIADLDDTLQAGASNGGIFAVASDGTLTGAGTTSDPLGLATSGVTPDTYGSSSQIPQFTVDQYGRITNVSEVNVAGVSDVTYDGNTSTLTIDTPDGSSFDTTINTFDSIDVNNGSITDVGEIKFSTTDGVFLPEGTASWTPSDGTLSIGMTGNNVTLQVGQEMLAYVKNNTANTITDGTVVGLAGAQDGRLLAQPFIADGSFLPGQIGGVATEDIAPDEFGYVNTYGYVRNLDTSGYSVGTFLYASANTPGEVTDTIPDSPNLKVIIGVVTEQDANAGSIFVRTNFTPIASDITYDNSGSNLVATNVKAALNELDSSKASVDLLSSTITVYATDTNSDITGYYKLVNTTDDPDFDDPAVDIDTGTITANNQLIAELAAEPGLFVGDPGPITVPTIGDIRRTAGTGTASFYFEVYRRDDTGTETLIATSSLTNAVSTSSYEQFSASALLSGSGSWELTDRIVLKFYGNRIDGTGSDPSYDFRFGGSNPVRTNFPVPVSVIPSEDASQIIADTSNFNNILSSTDSTVQEALETLDGHNHTTSEIPEGSRQYFTELRANNAIDNRVTKSFIDNLDVDADTLDSLDSTQFLRSDENTSADGIVTFNNNIEFVSPDGNDTIDVQMLDGGTLSFEGSSGQLFSITDSLTGTIFSVNDISGIPSIEVDDDGTIRFAEFAGNVLIGTDTDDGANKLQVSGNAIFNDTLTSNNMVVTGDLTVSGNVTYIDTTTLNIGDNIITLNKDESGTPTQDAGIEVERGTSTNVSLVWDEANDRWTIGNESFSSGSYRVGGYGEVINSSGEWVGDPDTVRGYTGSQGPIGYTGSQGDTGFTGSQGDQGPIGYTGSQGDQGPIGYTGSRGDTGYTGSQGDQGPIGYTGSQGDQGPIGYTGSQGDQGPIGYTGSRGFTGSQGDQGDIGFTGSRGYTGSQGDQGIQGPTGFSGSRGYTGSEGDQGPIGYTGSQGDTGFTGSKGDTGDQGPIGYTGSQGDTGFTGSQGDQGPIGYTGSQGDQGPIGYTGSRGFTGSQGDQGDIGFTGSRGYTGSQGDTGDQGPIGYTGSQGDTGDTGDQGPIGYTGSKGDIGYTGSKGDTGDTGDQGPIGYTGSQGDQGPIGYTGSQGDQGPIGYTGSQGDQGPIGYTGSQGDQGPIGYTGSRGDTGFTGSRGTQGYTGSEGPVAGNDGQLVYNNGGVAGGTTNVVYNDSENNTRINSTYAIDGTTTTLSTTSETEIANFSATTYGGAKVVIEAKEGANRHICELLITHDETNAYATQYGSVWTGNELATYDVDISSGNVRILATGASANSTVYRIVETLMLV